LGNGKGILLAQAAVTPNDLERRKVAQEWKGSSSEFAKVFCEKGLLALIPRICTFKASKVL
jgi:hypothetical protein